MPSEQVLKPEGRLARLKPLAAPAGLCAAAALLHYMAFPPVDLGPLIMIAFVPWLAALRGRSWISTLGLSYFAGFLIFFLGVFWISVVTFAMLVVCAVILAFFYAGAGAILKCLRDRFRLPLALALPLAVIPMDLLRSYFLSGFPWLYSGHAMYRVLPFIQIADVTGAYGVSALVLAVNGAAADLLFAAIARAGTRKAVAAACTVAALAALNLAYGFVRMDPGEETGPTVVMVQGNIPQDVKDAGQSSDEIWEKHVLLTLGASPGADLTIWPETMVPKPLSLDAEIMGGLKNLAADIDSPILAGAVWYDIRADGTLGPYNSAVLLLPSGEIAGKYFKVHRVPGGEYIPYRNLFPFVEHFVVAGFGYIPDVTPGRDQTLFDLRSRDGRNWKFGVLVCYENVFPSLARSQAAGGAQFLVNVTNDGWFKGSAELEQVLAIAAFRAVENRLTIVRSANTGISALVSPDGRVYGVLEKDGRRKEIEGRLAGRIRIDGRKTVFTAVGDLFAWLLSACSAALCVVAAVSAARKWAVFS